MSMIYYERNGDRVLVHLDEKQTEILQQADGVHVQIQSLLDKAMHNVKYIAIVDANGRVRGEAGTLAEILNPSRLVGPWGR